MPLDSMLRATLLGACALLTACAPRLFQRETLQIDHPDLEQFDIRYADFEGCLLKRPVPVSYRVKRALYTLSLDVHFGNADGAAGLDVGLIGSGDLSGRFPDLGSSPPATQTEDGMRYRIAASALSGSGFTLEVLQGGTPLAQEIIFVRRQHCRALSLGDGATP